jgi:hypothetical protein
MISSVGRTAIILLAETDQDDRFTGDANLSRLTLQCIRLRRHLSDSFRNLGSKKAFRIMATPHLFVSVRDNHDAGWKIREDSSVSEMVGVVLF